MKNHALKKRLGEEINDFLHSRKTLQLASLTTDGMPYASYTPFAIGEEYLYVFVSDIGVHALNLAANPRASILIVEDENQAERIYARVRVNYFVDAEQIENQSEAWKKGIQALHERHGDIVSELSLLGDFRLFKLHPKGGRYVKNYGRAYQLAEGSLSKEVMAHMQDGHPSRADKTLA